MTKKLPEKTSQIENWIYVEALVVPQRTYFLQWNFSEFILISVSQMLLHYSQWIETLVTYTSTALGIDRLTRLCILCFEIVTHPRCKVLNLRMSSAKNFFEDILTNAPGLMTVWRGIKKKNIAEHHSGRWWGTRVIILFFIEIIYCDEVAFYFTGDFFAPHFKFLFYFDDLFFSDAGCHLDL